MIAPEIEAMFVARFLQREATSKQTIAVKAEEKARGHDWVVPCDTVGCTEIIAVCRHIVGLEEALVDARQDLADTRHRRAKMSELHLRAITSTMARALRAEAALVEAMEIIAPFVEMCPPLVRHDTNTSKVMVSVSDLRAASAFAAKHGGRDGGNECNR